MSKRIQVVAACAVCVGAAAYASWASGLLEPLTDKSHGAIAACEGNIKAGLVAPSTYQRIRADYHEQPPLTLDLYAAYERTKYCGLSDLFEPCTDANLIAIAYAGEQILRARGIRRPTARQRDQARAESIRNNFSALNRLPSEQRRSARVSVEFDAQNAYGAPIRTLRSCRFGPMRFGRFQKGDIFDPPTAAAIGD
jgi:hypothetical protein